MSAKRKQSAVLRLLRGEDLALVSREHAFRDSYDRTWIVERHRYQTPAAVRAAQLAPLPVPARIRNAMSHNRGPLQPRTLVSSLNKSIGSRSQWHNV